MKLHDILTEAIDLTTHARLVKERIMTALMEGVKTIPIYHFKQAVKYVEETGSTTPLGDVLHEQLYNSLKHTLSRELSQVASDIFVPDGKSYIPVGFEEMKDSAHVRGLSVNFSTEWLSKITSSLADLVITVVIDNTSDDDLVGAFWDVKKNTNNIMLQSLYYDHRMVEYAEEMTSVFIHELAHIAQHFPQYRKGRQKLEYRSYLGKPGEFLNAHAKSRDHDWTAMYIASPQEIGARAQELALQVLQAFGLVYGYERDIPPTNEVAGVLQDFVDEWYPQPKTDRDRMIRNRYIKLAYQQIDRHLHQLREKQKQRDN